MNAVSRFLCSLLLLLLASCATTHHYSVSSDYAGAGGSQVSGDLSVTVSPYGVSVTPAVRYRYHSRPKQ